MTISVLSSAYGGPIFSAASPANPVAASTQSVTKTADGATITIVRQPQGGIISVTTVAPAHPGGPPETTESTVGITA